MTLLLFVLLYLLIGAVYTWLDFVLYPIIWTGKDEKLEKEIKGDMFRGEVWEHSDIPKVKELARQISRDCDVELEALKNSEKEFSRFAALVPKPVRIALSIVLWLPDLIWNLPNYFLRLRTWMIKRGNTELEKEIKEKEE